MRRTVLTGVMSLAIGAASITPQAGAGAQSLPILSPRFGAPPAASAITVALLAKARPTVDFLERASVLAETKAGAKRLRAFARREAADQAAARVALATVAAPIIVSADPLDSAAVVSASIDTGAETILSGLPRLLQTPGARAIAADRAITAQGDGDLARLTTIDGAAFDSFYKDTQTEGLQRLFHLYKDYVQNGDDLELLAVTVPELRRVKALIAALR